MREELEYLGIPDDVYKLGVKLLNSTYPSSNARGVMFFKKRDDTFNYKKIGNSYSICHVGLASMDTPNLGKAVLLITKGSEAAWKNGLPQTIKNGYVDWVLNSSPWSDPHLIKDVDYIQENGYHINLEFPNNYIASTCIITRHSWEFPHRIADWSTLVHDYGWNPTVALIFRYSSFLTENGATSHGWGNHPAFSGSGDISYYRNMFNKVFDSPNNLYSKTKTYSNVDALWGCPTYKYDEATPVWKSAYGHYLKIKKNSSEIKADPSLDVVNPWRKQIETIRKVTRASKDEETIPLEYLKEIGVFLEKEISGSN